MDLRSVIRTIPDFPKPGIMFRDVTTLFADHAAFRHAIEELADVIAPSKPTMVAGIEARGFIIGGALADRMSLGFLSVRKQGKLPPRTHAQSYDLEYGSATLEVNVEAAKAGDRIAMVDDLIATGGTALAAIELIKRLEAETVAFGAIIDLPELGGADRIRGAGVPVSALLGYEGH